jgi:signal transduction histidine kinase
VGERRRLAQGYLVVVAPATTLFGGELLDNGRGVGAELVDGPTILAASSARGRVPDLAAAAPVTAGGVTWSVYTWPTSARTSLPWVVLAIGVILAIGVALISRRVSRATEGLAQEALARAEEMGLVARTGPLLQQSLELGDLLPTFVAEVSDELDLDRVAISLMSERGQLVKMFSLGSAGSDVTESTLARTPPPTIPAGGDVIVPLQRSGRIVGAFTARAVSGLGAARMEALRAVCDLLAAAVGNVVVYQREQEMVRRLRDLDRMKTTFLGSVSHELRTMVTAIGGFAGLLASQPTPMSTERQAEYIGRIDRNATSLGLLIDDLLDFSRLERSGLSVAARPTDLSALVPAVVEQMSSLLDAHPLEVEVQPEVIAQADASAVERIIVNLLSNAAKYSPRGTPIHVELIRAADRAILSVADRGPGIPVEERSRVFDLFYRVDGPSTQAVRGVGIGLALVAELTALLDGTVIAEENPGGGALLRVSIPLAEGSHEPGANALVQHAGAT